MTGRVLQGTPGIGLMPGELHKKDFLGLFNLCFERPWLQNHGEALAELVEFCANRGEVDLVTDLLLRMVHLKSDERRTYWDNMASHIVNCGLSESDTQIVAATWDDEGDSAQSVLQTLKRPLAEHGWGRVRTVNRAGRSITHIKACPHVILVDEFVGSGQTMAKRVRDCTAEYQASLGGRGRYSIRVCVLASMEHARPRIEDEGADMYAAVWLRRGITHHYAGRARRRACRHMLRMEARLDQSEAKEEFPFGYDRTEALYSNDEGNAVNNLFPVFWWERLKGGKLRTPLLSRRT